MSEWVCYGCIMLLATCVIIQDRRIVELEQDMERMRAIYKDRVTKGEEVPS